MLADCDWGTCLCLDIGSARQMIGMGVSFEYPDNLEPTGLRVIQNCLDRKRGRPSATMIVIEHRIDDGGFAGLRIANQIADRVRRLIEIGVIWAGGPSSISLIYLLIVYE